LVVLHASLSLEVLVSEEKKSDDVTAFVVLHEERRLGWKNLRGIYEQVLLDSKYYGWGPERPDYKECKMVRQVFKDFASAEDWCASFAAHPAEAGGKPRTREAQGR
jgi:hypothetical protein